MTGPGLTIGSLCSGIGGLELGVEAATGGRTVWQADPDPHASTVLAARFPNVPNLGDLTAVDWADVEPVDLMCFGFPCQDISQAGRKAGIEGDRSALWFACADAVRLVRPRYVLVENVSALFVRGFDVVLGDLADMGHDALWGCLRSSDIGAPHRRERVFIAATLADPGGAGAGRHRGAVPRQVAPGGWPGTDVRPAVDGRENAPNPHGIGRQRAGPPTRVRAEPADRRDPAPDPTGSGDPHQPVSGPSPRLPERSLAGTSDRDRGGRPSPRSPDLGGTAGLVETWGPYGAAVGHWELIHGPAPAPRDDRGRLNPQLPEWMLGFEPGWVTDPALSIPRTAQLRLIGNAVQPGVAELATRLLLIPLMKEVDLATAV